MANIIKMYTRHKEIEDSKKEIFKLLDSFEFGDFINKKPNAINKIIMLVPVVYPNLGGVTSALRILNYLQNKGCMVTLCVCSNSMSIQETKRNVHLCMPTYKGSVKNIEDCMNENYDVCIATSWQTAYWAKKISGYKVYFVQDFEPEFYEMNDYSVLARDTYSFGYHIISLGGWNVDKIKLNCNYSKSKVDIIDFPYDPKEYSFDNRDYNLYKDKKDITIACYIRFIGRRIPYISEYLLNNTKKYLEERGYNLKILFYGIDKKNKFSSATNLGKLSRNQLFELYKSCDFGMTASMSNISLVPFEMLATGLPLIEYRNGSYSYFLGEDTAILIDFDYKELGARIIEAINNPDILKEMHEKSKERLEKLSWNNTCEQFWNILCSSKEK